MHRIGEAEGKRKKTNGTIKENQGRGWEKCRQRFGSLQNPRIKHQNRSVTKKKEEEKKKSYVTGKRVASGMDRNTSNP